MDRGVPALALRGHENTVTGAGIQDYGANAAQGVQSATWSMGVAPAYINALGPVTPNPRSTPVDHGMIGETRI